MHKFNQDVQNKTQDINGTYYSCKKLKYQWQISFPLIAFHLSKNLEVHRQTSTCIDDKTQNHSSAALCNPHLFHLTLSRIPILQQELPPLTSPTGQLSNGREVGEGGRLVSFRLDVGWSKRWSVETPKSEEGFGCWT